MAYSPRERGAKCDECPFKGRPFAPPDTKKALLTVLSKHPGDEEIEKQRILVGPTGRRVRGALERVGAAIHAITFNNLCLCRPPEKDLAFVLSLNRSAIEAQNQNCRSDLHQESTGHHDVPSVSEICWNGVGRGEAGVRRQTTRKDASRRTRRGSTSAIPNSLVRSGVAVSPPRIASRRHV